MKAYDIVCYFSSPYEREGDFPTLPFPPFIREGELEALLCSFLYAVFSFVGEFTAGECVEDVLML